MNSTKLGESTSCDVLFSGAFVITEVSTGGGRAPLASPGWCESRDGREMVLRAERVWPKLLCTREALTRAERRKALG